MRRREGKRHNRGRRTARETRRVVSGGKKDLSRETQSFVGVTFREEAFSAARRRRRGASGRVPAKSVTLSKESGTVAVDDEEPRADSIELLSTRDSSTFSTCTETCEANVILLDHEQLTYRYSGRDYRLTDVHGKVVKDVIA